MTDAQRGHVNACTVLIQEGGANVNVPNKNGATALMYAVSVGHFFVCELLLQNGADANAANLHGNTALMAAAHCTYKKKILQLLIENKADINAANKQGNTALMAAVEAANSDFLSILLESGADVNATRADGATALSLLFSSSANDCFHDYHYRLAAVQRLREHRVDLDSVRHITEHVVAIEHDIKNGTRLPDFPTKVSCVILRLTNKSGLTSMPPIQSLPDEVLHVEFDPSCGCITEFESSTSCNKIYDGFLSGSPGVHHLDFSIFSKIKNFGNNFLRNMKRLQSVHLTWSKELSSIGDNFISHSSHFKTVTVSQGTPTSSITSIGAAFLECSGVESLPTPLLTGVQRIGSRFMYMCQSLVELADTSSMANVVAVGEEFLCDCSNLKSINLEFCSRLDTIPNGFLEQCNKLSTIDLTPISHVTAIGDMFLCGTVSLRSVHLPFTALTEVGSCFLADNNIEERYERGLETYKLRKSCIQEVTVCPEMRDNKALKRIGSNFLRGCSSLRSVDLSFLSGVSQIGKRFLKNCSGVKTVDLSWFPSTVTAVPDGFLTGLESLDHLDLSSLSHVRSIGNEFLQDCKRLSSLDLTHFTQLSSVGGRFLANCDNLEEVDVVAFKRSLPNSM